MKPSKAHRNLPACILSDNVLALTQQLVVWDIPPSMRLIPLSNGPQAPSVDVSVPYPRLLIAGIQTSDGAPEMHVVAVRKKGPLRDDSWLFHAPLKGITELGMACVPSVDLPNIINPRAVSDWERALRNLHGQSVGHDKTLKPIDMTAKSAINTYHHTRFWRELHRGSAARFPGGSLVPRKQTVESWLLMLAERTV